MFMKEINFFMTSKKDYYYNLAIFIYRGGVRYQMKKKNLLSSKISCQKSGERGGGNMQ